MSFAVEARRSGREPITLVELHLDRCTLTYGQSPCAASLGVTGSSYCYNTRATCQDPDNYAPTPCKYRFSTPVTPLPVVASGDSPAAFESPLIPSLKSVDFTPASIDVSGGLGQRAGVSLSFDDHAHHDRWFDPYWRARSGTSGLALQATATGTALQATATGTALQARAAAAPQAVQGTFWGRFLARNLYYLGRKLVVRSGYITNPYDPDAFVTRTYVIEDIAGPDSAGRVSLKAKDPLKLADQAKAQAPRASTGRLAAPIDSATTSATLSPSGIGDAEYPVSGFVRMGSEVCSFTRSGDALTLVRAVFGTTSAAHDSDDVVQLCLRYAAELIPDIAYDLITGYTPVPLEYLPKAEWDAEAATYLTRTYSTIITSPTPVAELLKELSQQAAFALWYSETEALVKLRALRSTTDTLPLLDEDAELIADSVSVTDKGDLRVSQVWIFLAQIDPTESLNEPSNYHQLVVDADLESEAADKFGSPAIRKIFSRWLASRTAAQEAAERLRTLFGEQPKQVKFALDAKDAAQWWTGDLVQLRTRLSQAADGTARVLLGQITEAKEVEAAHRYEYTVQVYNFSVAPPTGQVISIAASVNDLNLLALYTSVYGVPNATTSVTFVVEAGVTIGQAAATAACRTDVWPAGAVIKLEINGRIQGQGGRGGGFAHGSGFDGGTALLVERQITIDNVGELWGGGGGGSMRPDSGDKFGGGGGAGTTPGAGGDGTGGRDGQAGTASSGGWGAEPGGGFGASNRGGDPGENGHRTSSHHHAVGVAGHYLIGQSLVTWQSTGDRRGRVA